MEKWIYRVSKDFLCDASAKIVGLDCEFTDKVKGIKQKLLRRINGNVQQFCSYVLPMTSFFFRYHK
jgi:hypothetical protein